MLTLEKIKKSQENIKKYLENEKNKSEIEYKLKNFKKSFFSAPLDEYAEREKILKNLQNIFCLFLEAKIIEEKKTLFEYFNEFNLKNNNIKNNILNYEEFRLFINSVESKINQVEVTKIISNFDLKKNGFIFYEDVESYYKINILKMGVPGGRWKLYVDFNEKVLCYHNFYKKEKILDFKITDQQLNEIFFDNLYDEAKYNCEEELKILKIEKWNNTIQNYMAKRIQFLFKLRKGLFFLFINLFINYFLYTVNIYLFFIFFY
jgi:hypothetical protein